MEPLAEHDQDKCADVIPFKGSWIPTQVDQDSYWHTDSAHQGRLKAVTYHLGQAVKLAFGRPIIEQNLDNEIN